MAGMANKKENFIAFFLSNPRRRPVEIVLPLLEIPGSIAKAWAIPITKLFLKFRRDLKLEFDAKKRKIPEIKNPKAITCKLKKVLSIIFLNKNPITATGIVAVTINKAILKFWLLKFKVKKSLKIDLISLSKNIITANKVAK